MKKCRNHSLSMILKSNEGKKMTKCILCNRENKMCRSHVFPKWIFDYIKENDHSQKKGVILIDKQTNISEKSKGFRGNIGICIECDRKIGDFDEFAKTFTTDDYIVRNGEEINSYAGLIAYKLSFSKEQYKLLKKFVASLLLRASRARDVFSSAVDLGPFEDDFIRYIAEGKETDYLQVAICKLVCPNASPAINNILIPFIRNKSSSGTMYQFVINGIEFLAFVGKYVNRLSLCDFFIKEGENYILVSPWSDHINVSSIVNLLRPALASKR